MTYMLLYKQADAKSDRTGSIIGAIGNPIGNLTGLFSKTPDDLDIQDYNDSSAMTLLPGVGRHRMIQRRKHLAKKYGGTVAGKLFSLNLGGVTSSLLLAAATGIIGTGIGAAVGGGEGALMGAGLGASVGAAGGLGASAVGKLIGLFRQPRSLQEEALYATSGGRTAAHYLLPGVAAHDRVRSAKSMLAEDVRIKDKKKKALESR